MKPIYLPLRTVNSLNAREHWGKKARRAKQERQLGFITTPVGLSTPITVNLVRLGPRKMDDDGLAASFKNLRDGIADKIGVNDGSDLIKFSYSQETSKTFGVRMSFN